MILSSWQAKMCLVVWHGMMGRCCLFTHKRFNDSGLHCPSGCKDDPWGNAGGLAELRFLRNQHIRIFRKKPFPAKRRQPFCKATEHTRPHSRGIETSPWTKGQDGPQVWSETPGAVIKVRQNTRKAGQIDYAILILCNEQWQRRAISGSQGFR